MMTNKLYNKILALVFIVIMFGFLLLFALSEKKEIDVAENMIGERKIIDQEYLEKTLELKIISQELFDKAFGVAENILEGRI